jgi:hypothetical protein
MRELPILFSTDMVLALMDGRKTQTRREITSRSPEMTALLVNLNAGIRVEETKAELIRCFSPYGSVGDWLWVRETWKPCGYNGYDETDTPFLIEYKADGKQMEEYFDVWEREEKYNNMLDAELLRKNIKLESDSKFPNDVNPLSYRPGIHLWKEFSRIWLENVVLSIERVQDISEADAIAEGVQKNKNGTWKNYLPRIESAYPSHQNAVGSFLSLWDLINGKENLINNSWVWVVKFKILSTTGKPVEAVV